MQMPPQMPHRPQKAWTPAPITRLHLTMFPLANEYLNTAHSMSWGLTAGYYELSMYHKLVSLGIACLYSVLEEQNLHPFVEIQTRLKLASLLMDETENYAEADRVLSKGIAVANKSNYYMLNLQLKYASIQAIAGSNSKSALRVLESCISDAQFMGPNVMTTLYALHFLKISILLASPTSHDYTQAMEELDNLESQREGQKQVACMAYVIHALKLIQDRQTSDAKPLLAIAEDIENEVKMQISQAQNNAMAMNMQPPVIYPIVVQVSMLRIVCQMILSLESSANESLERSITELTELMDSPALKVEGVWAKDGKFYLPLASMEHGNSGPASSMLAVHWITLAEGKILAMMMCGIARLRSTGEKRTARKYLLQALQNIKAELSWTSPVQNGQEQPNEPPAPPIISLTAAKERKNQLRLLQCYALFYLSIEGFLLSQWSDSTYLQELLQTAQLLPPYLNEKFLPQTFYLSGVFFQASGNAHNAIQFYLKIRANVTPGAELYILATINLILVLEAPQQVRYNTFERIPLEQERQHDRGGSTTPAALFRKELQQYCANHASPMIQWAWELIDYAYNTLSPPNGNESKKNSNSNNMDTNGGNELAIQNKLSLLVNYAMRLNSLQLGSIVAFLGAPRADPRERQLALASRGINDAYKSRDSLWMWMNGMVLEDLFKQSGNAEMAQRQHQNNQVSRESVEGRLNRVD